MKHHDIDSDVFFYRRFNLLRSNIATLSQISSSMMVIDYIFIIKSWDHWRKLAIVYVLVGLGGQSQLHLGVCDTVVTEQAKMSDNKMDFTTATEADSYGCMKVTRDIWSSMC